MTDHRPYMIVAAMCALLALASGCGKAESPTERIILDDSTVNTQPEAPPAPAPLSEAIARPGPAELPADPRPPETVIAVVNGTPVTVGDINARLNLMRRELIVQGRPTAQFDSERTETFKQLSKQLVQEELVEQAVKANGVTVPVDEVEAMVAKIRAGLRSDLTWEGYLAGLQLTETQFRGRLEKNLRQRALVDQMTTEAAKVPDEEVAAAYEKDIDKFNRPETVEARHILIPVKETDSPEAKAAKLKKCQDILKELRDGGDFAKLALDNSSCPSRRRGGSLGRFSRGQMVKPFETVAFAQEPGTVSDVVETKFGYHIIETTAKHEAGLMSFEEIKDRMREALSARKKQAAVLTFLDDLKAKAEITYPSD